MLPDKTITETKLQLTAQPCLTSVYVPLLKVWLSVRVDCSNIHFFKPAKKLLSCERHEIYFPSTIISDCAERMEMK